MSSTEPQRPRVKVSREEYIKLHRAAVLVNEQFSRIRFAILTRTFRIWRDEYPLVTKCDELARQLKERTFMLDTVRGSYLKDVINVKYHLDQLMKVQISDEALEKWQKNAYDLHVVPSVDIRELINRTKSCMQQSSAQMRENLIDAGFIDPETCRTLNPWEQSRSYRRLERLRKGPSHKFPQGGESIHLAAPGIAKVFVHHCNQCIGIAAVVKGWNTEVEKCMRFLAEHGQVETKISEYKRVIKSLQTILEEKEGEVVELTKKNNVLEQASQWFDKWSHTKDYLYQEGQHKEKVAVLQNRLHMAQEDKQATVWNVRLQFEERLSAAQEAIEDMEGELRRIHKEREIETSTRIKLNNDIQALFTDKQALKSEVDKLTVQKGKDQIVIAEQAAKMEQMDKAHVALEAKLAKKEVAFDEMKTRLTSENEALLRQVHSLTNDYNAKEKEADKLRDEVRSKTKLARKYLTTINRLHEEVDALKKELLSKARRKKFRILINCVLFLVRYRRALEQQDLSKLGFMGFKYLHMIDDKHNMDLTANVQEQAAQLAQLQTDYDKLQDKFEVMNMRYLELETQYQGLERDFANAQSMLQSKEQQLLDAMALNNSLHSMLDNYQKSFEEMSKHKPVAIQVANKLKSDATNRVHLLYKSQRNIIFNLTYLLFRVRCIIHNIDPIRGVQYVKREQGRCDVIYENYLNMSQAPPTMRSSLIMANGSFSAVQGSIMSPAQTATNSTIELNNRFLNSRRASTLNALAVIRGKGHRVMKFIQSHKHTNILTNDYKILDKWVRWIKLTDDKAPGDKEEDEKVVRTELVQTINRDHMLVHHIHRTVIGDIYNIQGYLQTYKRAYNEALERMDAIHHREMDERAKRAMQSDRSVVSQSSGGTKKKRNKVMQIKQNFAHMLDTDVPGYLANVLKAIETVQQEHGDIYEETASPKLDALTMMSVEDAVVSPSIGKPAVSGRARRGSFRPGKAMWSANLPAALEAEESTIHEEPSVVKEASLDAIDDQAVSALEAGASTSRGDVKEVPVAAAEEEFGDTTNSSVHPTPASRIIPLAGQSPVVSLSNPDGAPSTVQQAVSAGPRPASIPVNFSAESASIQKQAPLPDTSVQAPKDHVESTMPIGQTVPVHVAAKPVSVSPAAAASTTIPRAVSQPVNSTVLTPAVGESKSSAVLHAAHHIEVVQSAPVQPQSRTDVSNNVASIAAAVKKDAPIASASFVKLASGMSKPAPANVQSADASEVKPVSSTEDHHGVKRRETQVGKLAKLVSNQLADQPAGAESVPATKHTMPATVRSAPIDPVSSKAASNSSLNSHHTPALPASPPRVPSPPLMSPAGRSSPPMRPGSAHRSQSIISDDEDDYGSEDDSVQQEMADMTVLHGEVLALLNRDNELQASIAGLEATNTILRNEMHAHQQELWGQRDMIADLQHRNVTLTEDVQKTLARFEGTLHENGLLREIVYDSFRYQSKEIESLLQRLRGDMQAKIDAYEARLPFQVLKIDQGTQINCSVCAVREHNRPAEGSVHGIGPGIYEPLSAALGGNVRVLVPNRQRIVPSPQPVSHEEQEEQPFVEKIMSVLATSVSKSSAAQTDSSNGAAQQDDAMGGKPAKLVRSNSPMLAALSSSTESQQDPKHLLDFARSLLRQARPRSASPLPRPQRSSSDMLLRPQSGKEITDSVLRTVPTASNMMSKFRKLKQMPGTESGGGETAFFTESRRRREARDVVNSAAFLQDTQHLHPMGGAIRPLSGRAQSASALHTTKHYGSGNSSKKHRPYSAEDREVDEFVISDDDEDGRSLS